MTCVYAEEIGLAIGLVLANSPFLAAVLPVSSLPPWLATLPGRGGQTLFLPAVLPPLVLESTFVNGLASPPEVPLSKFPRASCTWVEEGEVPLPIPLVVSSLQEEEEAVVSLLLFLLLLSLSTARPFDAALPSLPLVSVAFSFWFPDVTLRLVVLSVCSSFITTLMERIVYHGYSPLK